MVDFDNGKELVEALVERFGSKNKAARELHVTDKTLRNWEQGKRHPTATRRVDILCLLDSDDPDDRLDRIKKYNLTRYAANHPTKYVRYKKALNIW